MLQLFEFRAYNTQAMYGWGDADEADQYCDFLNRNREVNAYSVTEITDTDEIDRHDRHDRHDSNADGVNLADALIEIANEAAE
jgi:hypothetical protein